MRMKTTDDMWKVNTLLANCNRNFAKLTIISLGKCINIMVGFKMQKKTTHFDAIIDVL